MYHICKNLPLFDQLMNRHNNIWCLPYFRSFAESLRKYCS
ncbi:hypothetical protein HMPREF1554_00598 [Porphyromonas gingivalis F0569]|nr:hypothetical protein HMPREF1554_00598 [Porphyromonas gingivalis F0569]